MRGEGGAALRTALARKRDTIVQGWLAETLRTYSEQAAPFLSQDPDPFRNPVGHTLGLALPALFDALLDETNAAGMAPLLEGTVRLRAVQDFSPSQAVAFVFCLKPVIRAALTEEAEAMADSEGLAAVEARIDELALMAFDLYVRCREQLFEIKANVVRRRTFVRDRMSRERPGVG